MSAIKHPAGQTSKPCAQTLESLNQLLAECYTLQLKTQNYHWNVTGPHFRELHLMFEEQYQALFLAVDELAERIRTLGELAPATHSEFSKLSKLKEGDSRLSAKDMVNDLVKSHKHMIDAYSKSLECARAESDAGTEDLFIQQLKYHEKTCWMLQSLLDDWK